MHEQYDWYVEECLHSELRTFAWRYNLSIASLQTSTSDVVLSGEVSRIDIQPSGGYAAWLFRGREPEDWFNELRMPLIQLELSITLGDIPLNEILVGIYSFEERFIAQRCYSVQEVTEAQQRVRHLFIELGFQ